MLAKIPLILTKIKFVAQRMLRQFHMRKPLLAGAVICSWWHTAALMLDVTLGEGESGEEGEK